MQYLTTLPTLISIDRLCNLIKYSTYASQRFPNAALCEFGMYKGGSLEVITKFNSNRDIFGIDSFQGLPKESEHDFHREGDFNDTDYYSVAGYFKMVYPNVKILKGFSPKVFEYFDESVFFSFVHIDVDLYSSVLDALNFFFPRLVLGGVIVLDDYKVNSTPGCKKAIDEYFYYGVTASHGEELKYFSTESSESHKQYLIVK